MKIFVETSWSEDTPVFIYRVKKKAEREQDVRDFEAMEARAAARDQRKAAARKAAGAPPRGRESSRNQQEGEPKRIEL